MHLVDAAVPGHLADGLVTVPNRGPGVCATCRDFIPRGYIRCRHCRTTHHVADAVLPISLCTAGGPMHAALRGYKDATAGDARQRIARRLATLVDGFLERHEACLATAAGADAFDTVTVVPSASPVGDELRPALRQLAGELSHQTRRRHVRLLTATGAVGLAHGFDERRYRADVETAGRRVLLLEDAWVTGGRACSAAAALRAVGALSVAVLVLGRYLDLRYGDNAARLAELSPWSVGRCSSSVCAGTPR